MKTNKSYTKRLKVTRKGKVIARYPGQNHFNAKEPGVGKLRKRGAQALKLSNKIRSRFIA